MRRLAAVLVTVTLVASGCGGDDRKTVVLSQDQADSALLTQQDVPAGFVQGEESQDKVELLGCLSAADDLDKLTSKTKANVTFLLPSNELVVGVTSAVTSYSTEKQIKTGFADFRKGLTECTKIDETKDGVHTVLDITVDEKATTDEADEQVNLTATGTISANQVDYPYLVRYSATRVVNNLTLVAAYQVGDPTGDSAVVKDLDTYNATVMSRLIDVTSK